MSVFSLSYDWIVGIIFSQWVFPPQNGHKNGHFFKTHFLKHYCFKKCILGFSKFAISEPFLNLKNRHPKNNFYGVFWNTLFAFFQKRALFLKRGFWKLEKWRKSKKRWLICKKKGNPQNTDLDQKSSQKSKKPIFIVRKWPPKRWTN